MDTFEHDGVVIAYQHCGTGPAILFLHNGGASSTIWRHQVADLATRFQTVAVDLPGFGCSPRPVDGIDLDGQVELLAALIRELELDPVLVVGNCMGSNIAVQLATEHPRLVAGLVLVNPLTEATFSAGGLGLLHTMYRRMPGPTQTMRSLARRVVPPRVAARATLRFQIGSKGVARGLQRDPVLLQNIRRREQLPALIDVLDDMRAYGSLDGESATALPPICTIWGMQNRVLSPSAGRALNGRLRPQCAEELDGCGHLPMLEDPAAVTAIVERFAQARRLDDARRGARR